MRATFFVLAAAALGSLGGCANDVCANVQGTCVALRIDGNGSLGTVQITASGPTSGTSTANGSVTSMPFVMPLRFQPGVSGPVQLDVVGSINGTLVGSGTTAVQVIDGQHTTGSVFLGGRNDIADAGVNKDGGFGGTGGTGGGGAGGCGGGCPPPSTCGTDGLCHQQQMAQLGGICAQDGTIMCASAGGKPVECAPDNICRFSCAGTPDCTNMMPMTECFQFNGAGPGYCTLVCNAVPPSPNQNGCTAGLNCVVWNYSTSVTDCVQPDGKNYPPGQICAAHEDCATGESCYVKAGQDMGTCRGNCYTNNSSCQVPPSGTCQVPTGPGTHWGVCCPPATSCL